MKLEGRREWGLRNFKKDGQMEREGVTEIG